MQDYFLLWLEKTLSKLIRPFTRLVVSNSRISQRSFANMASKLGKIKPKQIFHIKSDYIPNILSNSEFLNNRKVLIFGGTDYNIDESQYQKLASQKSSVIYIQNLNFLETENVRLLPIGVEDIKWGRNGMPWNFRDALFKKQKKDQVLVGPFANTNLDRADCLRKAKLLSNCEVHESRLPNWIYSSLASEFHFVACPSGNGFDTHRFWETLYRGSIPVVLESRWAQNLMSHGIPLAVISDWNQLGELTIAALGGKGATPLNFLETEWWLTRFREDLQSLITS
jgi:hypothetical protein